MEFKKEVKVDRMPELEKIIKSLENDEIQIGIFGEDDSFLLLIATVHEFGTTIKPKTAKFLTVPCNPKSYGKSATDFDNLWTFEDSEGQFWLVRDKGKDRIEFMYMLAKEVVIPERSFLRGAFDENKIAIDKYIDDRLDELLTFKISLNQFYNSIGERIVSIIKKHMADLKDPPKSPITLAANPDKENPLIDTGQLRNSIVWKVKRR